MPTATRKDWRASWVADLVLLLGVFALLTGTAAVGRGMLEAFKPPDVLPTVELDPRMLPYYAARSTLRMFLALGMSLVFTLVYGNLAAKNKRAERVLIPLLDVLQSVPVLGFLSVTVTLFISLFPGSLLGLECASVFAIFTGQAWNMAFSFYYSLTSLPKELDEAAKVFRLTKRQRFWKVEVPSAMIPLIWNGMMSFGGGWFFVSASEAISVLNKNYTLPGLGSFVAKAIEKGDLSAVGWAVVTMAVIIVVVDQFFWKPLVAWSTKFKMEKSAAQTAPKSWVYDLLRKSRIPSLVERAGRRLNKILRRGRRPSFPPVFVEKTPNKAGDQVFTVLIGVGLAAAGFVAASFVLKSLKPQEVLECFGLGWLTFLRVALLVVLSTVVWVPIGVAIGFSPKLARYLQPVVQFLASFPANFLFPVATVFFIRTGIHMNWGSILLMSLGAQWYVLFNTIAGAMAVPGDLREMARNMRLSRVTLWKKIIIPAIFPAWVTGAITASGGAWNASIVSEIVKWGDQPLKAQGLGTYISEATGEGNWPKIVLGVTLMCVFVVATNRLFWRRLYKLAKTRYKLS